MLYYDPPLWEEQFDVVFGSVRRIAVQRHYYTCRTLSQDWRGRLLDGFTLHEVDAVLLAQRQLKHLDALEEEMCSERASLPEFLERSFGVCLVQAEEIVGWCLSEYNCAQG